VADGASPDGATPGRRIAALLVAIPVVVALGVAIGVARQSQSPVPDAQACLERSSTKVLSGIQEAQYRVGAPKADWTLDARRATFTGYPFETLYPLTVGADRPARHLCVMGGLVRGQQSRDLTWDEVKNQHDGTGARIAGNDWYVVDGLRVDNIEDGIDPRGTDDQYPKDGDGFVLRNLYFRYIRDDCVENDDIAGGVIEDSLFDGCNTGISERPSDGSPQLRHPADEGETLELRGVLLRLQAMPGPRGEAATVRGHGQLFKWSDVANRLVVRDSIFLVETTPNGGTTSFPPGTVAEDVTVVWLGEGPFPGEVPEGVTITTDRSVWDRARTRWLARHGCADFTDCDRLIDPSQ